jgi:tetratricopeptide (TPR) repeat protein
MATYKKRGNKVRRSTKGVDDLQKINYDGESTTEEVFSTLDETANRSEQWFEKNQKIIYVILGAFLVGLLAYMAYTKLYAEPNELKGADHLAYSKAYFDEAEAAVINQDSLYNIALNGIDNKYGLIDVAKKYSGTNAGNLAKYMAGISYLRLSEYQKAVDYLKDFSSDDELLSTIAKGSVGDAYSDVNQPNDALKYYKAAANLRDNSFSTPLYLFKAGNTALQLKKFDEALKLFERIKNDYPNSSEAKEIQIYINRAKYASK